MITNTSRGSPNPRSRFQSTKRKCGEIRLSSRVGSPFRAPWKCGRQSSLSEAVPRRVPEHRLPCKRRRHYCSSSRESDRELLRREEINLSSTSKSAATAAAPLGTVIFRGECGSGGSSSSLLPQPASRLTNQARASQAWARAAERQDQVRWVVVRDTLSPIIGHVCTGFPNTTEND